MDRTRLGQAAIVIGAWLMAYVWASEQQFYVSGLDSTGAAVLFATGAAAIAGGLLAMGRR